MSRLFTRAISKGRRMLATRFRRRELRIDTPVPVISFSFDDAPRSAFVLGGDILSAHGGRATYFISIGLLDSDTEVGLIAGVDHLKKAVEAGHELGCHTFGHLDAWHTARSTFIASVDANQRSLNDILPGYSFRTFAYPKSGARLSIKADLERRFSCCRGGGQSINTGIVDLNLLNACFLDRRAKVDMQFIRDLIDRNARSRGWLIFAAHDISESDLLFGCSTAFFTDVVKCAAESGADLIPVWEACSRLQQGRRPTGAPG
jgi:hypothetical protein